MTTRELWKKLKKNGWSQAHGAKHDMAVDPNSPNHLVPIPRHTDDIPIGTLKSILNETGLR